jgi:CheY-like chemotaxis protein
MDGLEFLRAMRSDPTTRSVPVIFLTSRIEAEDQAKKLGAVAFLAKPVRAADLLSAVAAQLEARRAA